MNKVLVAFVVLTVAACDGGNTTTDPTAMNPVIEILPIKTFRFSWTDVAGATSYRVLENPDGLSGFVQVSDDIPERVNLFCTLNLKIM